MRQRKTKILRLLRKESIPVGSTVICNYPSDSGKVLDAKTISAPLGKTYRVYKVDLKNSGIEWINEIYLIGGN